MNCFMCGGFLLSNDKHTVGKKVFHKNCWGRLDRKQQKIIQEESMLKIQNEFGFSKTNKKI